MMFLKVIKRLQRMCPERRGLCITAHQNENN